MFQAGVRSCCRSPRRVRDGVLVGIIIGIDEHGQGYAVRLDRILEMEGQT